MPLSVLVSSLEGPRSPGLLAAGMPKGNWNRASLRQRRRDHTSWLFPLRGSALYCRRWTSPRLMSRVFCTDMTFPTPSLYTQHMCTCMCAHSLLQPPLLCMYASMHALAGL